MSGSLVEVVGGGDDDGIGGCIVHRKEKKYDEYKLHIENGAHCFNIIVHNRVIFLIFFVFHSTRTVLCVVCVCVLFFNFS